MPSIPKLEAEPQNGDPANPVTWSVEKVVTESQSLPKPLKEGYTVEEFDFARAKLWTRYMDANKRLQKKAKEALRERVRIAWESGVAMEAIMAATHVSQKNIYSWATRFKWKRPDVLTESGALSADPAKMRKALKELARTDEQVAVVVKRDEQALPRALQETKKQSILMTLKDTDIDKLPVKEWGLLFRLRIGKLALRAVQRLERMDDDELSDPQSIKTLKSLSDIAGTVSPPEQTEGPRRGSLLNEAVLMGVVQFPVPQQQEKLADAKEIDVDATPETAFNQLP